MPRNLGLLCSPHSSYASCACHSCQHLLPASDYISDTFIQSNRLPDCLVSSNLSLSTRVCCQVFDRGLHHLSSAWDVYACKILCAKASLFPFSPLLNRQNRFLRADLAEEAEAGQQTGRIRSCGSWPSGRKSTYLSFIQSFSLFIPASQQCLFIYLFI